MVLYQGSFDVYLVDKPPSGTVAARILTHFCLSFIATVGLVALYMWTLLCSELYLPCREFLYSLCSTFVFHVSCLLIGLFCYQGKETLLSSNFLRKSKWEVYSLKPGVCEHCHYIFRYLIDNLARYRNLGWKIFFFRILKALFHYLFASITADKSEAILISDFPCTGSC